MGKNSNESSAPSHWLRRHKTTLAVSAGVAVLAGVAVVTNEPPSDAPTDSGRGTTAVAQRTTEPSAGGKPPKPGPQGPVPDRRGVPTSPPAAGERVAAMKGKAAEAAKNNVQVQRAPVPVRNGPIIPDDEIITVETGDIRRDRRMLRVVAARGDLTGQRSLAWVDGEGEKVGNARCTQSIKLSNNPKPKYRPTLLLCWRTSTARSVYTLLVDLEKPPSRQRSVAALEKAWAKLG